MIWQFWAVVWGWLATVPLLIGGGLYLEGPASKVLIVIGIADAVAWVGAMLWFANKLNTDV